jgi:hypothetical protein
LIQPVSKTRSAGKRHRVMRQRISRNNRAVSTPAEVSPDLDQLLRTAISLRRNVRFWYEGKERISEPHDYGIQNGRVRLLTYQVGGQSTGKLPGWRMFDVARICKLEILANPFSGSRPASGKPHKWERVFLRVQAA